MYQIVAGYNKQGVVLQDRCNKRRGHNKWGALVWWEITLKACGEQ